MSPLLIMPLSLAFASPAVESRYAASTQAERAGQYDLAVSACADVLALESGGARSKSCSQRVERLNARRDLSGAFYGLQSLEHVRRQHRERGPDAGETALRTLLMSRDLSDTLRAEVGVWLARDALDRQDDAVLSAADCAKALEGQGIDETVRRQLLSLQSRSLAGLGEYEQALAVESEIRIGATRLSPVDRMILEQRRAGWTRVAGGILGGFSLLTLLPAARTWLGPTRPRPVGLWVIGLGTVVAAGICYGWAKDSANAVIVAGVLFSVIHLLSLGALTTLQATRWLLPTRIASAMATGAALWIAVAWTNAFDWMGW